jgi:nucleotide-binding universal stress UspA family protein
MNAWIVLFLIAALAALFVLIPVGAATFAHYRTARRRRCPVTGTEATVEVDATAAALAEVAGGSAVTVQGCSRWPTWGCRQACLQDERAGHREAPAARPAANGRRTILVPLDGTPEAEAVLPRVETIARQERARIRLVHVSPPPDAVREDERIISYADQETDRVEREALGYLDDVAERLPGVPVERVVRFGEPAPEILAETEESGADLIAMATHDRTGLARLRRGSVTDAVAHGTLVPVIRVSPADAGPRP